VPHYFADHLNAEKTGPPITAPSAVPGAEMLLKRSAKSLLVWVALSSQYYMREKLFTFTMGCPV
jgi:hypothetical protein